MPNSQINTTKTAAVRPVDLPTNNECSRMIMPTWSALFKHQNAAGSTAPRSLLDLPTEIIDIILGRTCANWGVLTIQLPRASRHRGPIIIAPHVQSAENGAGLAPLAATNSLLYSHLKRCLHTPASFSGCTQLVDVDVRSLHHTQGQEIFLDPCISAFWTDASPQQVLQWVLDNTKVLEMKWMVWEAQPISVDLGKFFPRIERFILVAGLQVAFSVSTVKEIREAMASKIRELEWSNGMWERRIRQLVAAGIQITFRMAVFHPSRWRGRGWCDAEPNDVLRDYHPTILSLDVKATPSDPIDIHVRPGPRDFHSPCCPIGCLSDSTLQYTYAEVAASGFKFKHANSQSTQPCDICRHWRPIWAGVNGYRRRFNDKNLKASIGGARR